ncbi:MAG TPA: beta-ketoacyl synthase N-terminal-like domain-containing protein [Anaerolineales bacterium]|jgi:acetyl-CoA C-acetyltransferase
MTATTNATGRRVWIAGVGLTPVREHWERSLRDLAHQAMQAAMDDAGGLRPQALYVANMLSGALSGQTQLGALLADYGGLRGVEAHTVEAAGASGGMALRQAYLAIRAGEIDTALVVGVEKVSEKVTAEVEAALVSATDTDFEAAQGVTPTAQAALLMRRYLHQHQAPADALAGFSLTAHEHGATNPNAMFQKAIKLEAYQRGALISDPVNMFDAAPLADGAAALLLVGEGVAPEGGPVPLVRIAGSAAASSALALHDQPDPLRPETVSQTTRQALERAGIDHDSIDLYELHDSFTIFAALSLEAAGFAEPGTAWKMAADGAWKRGGKLPIGTMGGSKARGETAGATGVYQAVEAALQLQGRAGGSQVEGARWALIQCLGGNGATCATHVLTVAG